MPGLWWAVQETLLLGGLFHFYKFVRLLIAGRVATAFENAGHVLALERALHLDVERGLQQLVLRSEPLVVTFNRYYVNMHFATTVVFLVWLFATHRAWYPHVRRVLVAATALALGLHAVFPLAPPRMLPGFVDTMAVYGPNAYDSEQVVALANQYAAMPSVHFLWSAVVAYGVIRASRWRYRWVVLAHPAVTLAAIVVTANHFWLDAAVAASLLAGVLVVDATLRLTAGPEGAPTADRATRRTARWSNLAR